MRPDAGGTFLTKHCVAMPWGSHTSRSMLLRTVFFTVACSETFSFSHTNQARRGIKKGKRQIFRPTHHFQKHSPRRARPSHEMRVGNSCRQELTSPKILTKGQNQTLPATATQSLFHAIRYVDDDGRVEENTLDNTTTDDEEDHTDVQENQENVLQPHTLQTSTISPTANAHDPDSEQEEDTIEHSHFHLNEQEESRPRHRQQLRHRQCVTMRRTR